MLLSELIRDVETECIHGPAEREIPDITNDSRKTVSGGLYFAIPGFRVDGAAFLPDVLKKGAGCVVTEKDTSEIDEILRQASAGDEGKKAGGDKAVCLADYPDLTVLRVKNARKAMGIMSGHFYGDPSEKLTVIGLTGTKGKTTTSVMIREMLEKAGHKTGLVGTIEILNGRERIPAANTTPESIKLHEELKKMLENGLDSVVMEVSSQGLKLDRVAGVDFDYGIFTNLSPDHIGKDEHSSYEEYRDCKKLLFGLCRTGIYHTDDPEAAYMMDGAAGRKLTFGRREDADYRAEDIRLYREGGVLGTAFRLTGKKNAEVRVDLPGTFSVENALAAIAVASEMGVPMEKIKEILLDIHVRGRVEMIPISDEFTLMIDYAHNAMSLRSLLTSLRAYNPGRIVTLFGCGGNRAKDRRYGMGEVSGELSDLSIITSDNPRFEDPQAIIDDIKVGIGKTSGKYVEIIDRKEAVRYAILNAKPGDLIVLAGKGHEDYQEICGVKHHMDERDLIREVIEESDVTKICGYHNQYFT